MGSYATWRGAMLVLLFPETLLDGTLRDQQTPEFTTMVQSLQQGPALTAGQARQLACQYDAYFRDICSIKVQASCLVQSRLDDGESCAGSGAPQSAQLLDMFGFAENSKTVYWSTYNKQDTSGYAQTFWNQVPGLSGQQLTAISGAAPFQDHSERMWVLLIYQVSTTSGPALGVTRYDPDIPGLDGWEGTAYPLPGLSDWTSFSAQLGPQNGVTDPPTVVVTLPDGSYYVRQLSLDGTGWSDVNWMQAGAWVSWAPAVTANVFMNENAGTANDIAISVVSRNTHSLDLFWVDEDSDNVQYSSADATVNNNQFTSPLNIDPSFSAGSYVTALARSPDHLDVFAAQGPGDNITGSILWSWWDANVDDAQWHPFQPLPDITPNPVTGGRILAVTTGGHRVDVFGYSREAANSAAATIVWTWRSDSPAADDYWHPWVPVGAPISSLFGEPCVIARDDNHIDLFVYDQDNGISHNYLDIPFGNWQGQWSVISNMVAPFLLGAVAPTADTVYLFADGPRSSRGDFSSSAAGSWTAFELIPNSAAAAIGGDVAALSRRPTRLDVFYRDSSVYGSYSEQGVGGGAFQPWVAISDSSTIPATYSLLRGTVSSASRSPGRIDLFTPGGTGGIGGDGSASIYTSYWQDIDWTSTPPELPPFSPIPVTTANTPLDIPAQLSSNDLQARRTGIQETFQANLAVAAGFTEPAPASTLAYLQEAYYFVPMYLANQLCQQGQFTAALDWYRTTTTTASPSRSATSTMAWSSTRISRPFTRWPANWLQDPLNPHAIAATRRYAYTRYTVLQIVQCMFSYADSLFTADTSESDAEARTWYMTGLELLSLAIFSQSSDPCAGLTIPVLDTPVDGPWTGLLPQLAGSMTAIDRPSVLATLVPQVIHALGGKTTWPDRFAAAQALIVTEPGGPAGLSHCRGSTGHPQRQCRSRLRGAARHPARGPGGYSYRSGRRCRDQFRCHVLGRRHIRGGRPAGRDGPSDGSRGRDNRAGPRRRKGGSCGCHSGPGSHPDKADS